MMETTGIPSPLMGEGEGGGGQEKFRFPLTFILSRQGRGEFWRYSKSFSRLLIPNAKLDN